MLVTRAAWRLPRVSLFLLCLFLHVKDVARNTQQCTTVHGLCCRHACCHRPCPFLPLVASSWLIVLLLPLFLLHSHIPPHHVTPRLLSQEFATSGSNNTDSGKSSGHLETKYKMSDLGLNFTQKWNTDNTLTTEVTMEDQVGSRNRGCSHLTPK